MTDTDHLAAVKDILLDLARNAKSERHRLSAARELARLVKPPPRRKPPATRNPWAQPRDDAE